MGQGPREAWGEPERGCDQDGEEEKARKRLRLWTVNHGVRGGVQWTVCLFLFKWTIDQSIMHVSGVLVL